MMNTLSLRLSLILLATVTACDPKDQCVADCDPQSATDSDTDPGETETNADSETESMPNDAICDALTQEATLFLEENRACETVLDCAAVDGICYGGPVSSPCGSVAVSAEADQTAWQDIAAGLAGSCECGANACGSVIMCNEAQQCESSFGSADFCPSIERDVQTFLAANRACETDDDCVPVESICHVDDCSVVALNVDASEDDWKRLDNILWECGLDDTSVCNYVGDCGPSISCNASGQCEANF